MRPENDAGKDVAPSDTYRAHTPSENTSEACTPGARRSVEFTEPDWAPFAHEHERIRDRVETDTMSFDNNHSLPSLPPPTLGDGEQFWAQHFSHSANRHGEPQECHDEPIEPTVVGDATEIESPSSPTQKREIAGALAQSQGRTTELTQSQAPLNEAQRSASTSELMYAALQQADVPTEHHRAPSKRKSDSDIETSAHQRSRQNNYEESSPNLFQKVANMANIAAPRWSYMNLPRSVVRSGLRAF